MSLILIHEWTCSRCTHNSNDTLIFQHIKYTLLCRIQYLAHLLCYNFIFLIFIFLQLLSLFSGYVLTLVLIIKIHLHWTSFYRYNFCFILSINCLSFFSVHLPLDYTSLKPIHLMYLLVLYLTASGHLRPIPYTFCNRPHLFLKIHLKNKQNYYNTCIQITIHFNQNQLLDTISFGTLYFYFYFHNCIKNVTLNDFEM